MSAHANGAMPDDDRFDASDEPPNARCSHLFFRGDHVELAEAVVADLGGRDVFVFDEGAPHTYEPTGIWETVDLARASRIVQGYAGMPVGAGERKLKIKASDVTGAIRLAHDQVARPGFFAGAAGVAFSDCVVVATANGLDVRSHAPGNRVRAGYSFAYEKGALPRRFLAFVASLFRDDTDAHEKEALYQEFLGACILGIAPRYQRCIVATGSGDNGKSAFGEVMTECMPPGTTCAIAPQDWGQEYRRAMLAGKRLNQVSELPERDILASESFKAIVSGDPIVGRMIRERPETIRPIAGHHMSANRLPGAVDQSEGFWRRFAVCTYNRSFKNDPERDPHIVERVLTERPAIVAWMLAGAERLIRERTYTLPSSHHRALTAWRRSADTVLLFVQSDLRELRPDEHAEAGLYAADLYQAYRRWAERNGHRPMASNRLGGRMRDLGHAPTKTRTGWRYPLTEMTALERADRVTDGDGLVTDFGSPVSRESGEGSHA